MTLPDVLTQLVDEFDLPQAGWFNTMLRGLWQAEKDLGTDPSDLGTGYTAVTDLANLFLAAARMEFGIFTIDLPSDTAIEVTFQHPERFTDETKMVVFIMPIVGIQGPPDWRELAYQQQDLRRWRRRSRWLRVLPEEPHDGDERARRDLSLLGHGGRPLMRGSSFGTAQDDAALLVEGGHGVLRQPAQRVAGHLPGHRLRHRTGRVRSDRPRSIKLPGPESPAYGAVPLRDRPIHPSWLHGEPIGHVRQPGKILRHAQGLPDVQPADGSCWR